MSQELLDLIERVERSHFRTHGDTGAHGNALLIWNIVREAAGLQPLTKRDLMERALRDYREHAGLALQRGEPDKAAQYARAATEVEKEMRALPRVIRETRCFS